MKDDILMSGTYAIFVSIFFTYHSYLIYQICWNSCFYDCGNIARVVGSVMEGHLCGWGDEHLHTTSGGACQISMQPDHPGSYMYVGQCAADTSVCLMNS